MTTSATQPCNIYCYDYLPTEVLYRPCVTSDNLLRYRTQDEHGRHNRLGADSCTDLGKKNPNSYVWHDAGMTRETWLGSNLLIHVADCGDDGHGCHHMIGAVNMVTIPQKMSLSNLPHSLH